MMKKLVGMVLLAMTMTATAVDFGAYDQYAYYGDTFQLKVHPGNYVLVKYNNEAPFYLNGGEPFSSPLFEVYVDAPIKAGSYKLLEIELQKGNVNNFWETTVYVSEHRSCFSPLPMVGYCSNKKK